MSNTNRFGQHSPKRTLYIALCQYSLSRASAVIVFRGARLWDRTGSGGGRIGGQAVVRARAGANAERERLPRGPGKGTLHIHPHFFACLIILLAFACTVLHTFLICQKRHFMLYVYARTELHVVLRDNGEIVQIFRTWYVVCIMLPRF